MSTPHPESNAPILVVIPCYQEAATIGDVVAETIKLGFDTLAIDDGSTDDTANIAQAAGATVFRHEGNQGKGAAVETGLRYALDRGYGAAILLDGDGQHLPAEIPRFVEAFQSTGADMIVGSRMADTQKMPFLRRQTNRLMSAVLSRQMKQHLSDTQCGFRLISRTAIPEALRCTSTGFSMDSEMLLHLSLLGYQIIEVPVSTVYGDEKSKIQPIRDTLRFVRMLGDFRRRRHEWMRAGRPGAVER